ncbi:hypothetical protein [Gloeobacter morelensis]|uniref:GspL cytoplasmic actin-ATPase-like domain-containing protein n=1 Tax=Gloeobacter morelensis MG652769 TaxID=2781736 RepID=A0ABY3PIV0_9CYAN|nr:hypothetical protein [Gloeobacter morelensis]UFP93483.1 hypothetical protein ISF26_17025 [Gloeobacter morelensis MG652769]
MFALAEILDKPWARAAVSEQFNVWRGEEEQWKLYLPGPVRSWKEPPDSELVVEGTETIRSLIGGEEWRVWTLDTQPLIACIQDFPKLGHWDEDEEAEAFVPFLQAGLEALRLRAEHFEVEAQGAVQFLPAGLGDLDNAQIQALIEKRPRTWKVRPPRGGPWTPTWQMLWTWIEAARILWQTHFINSVSTLAQAYPELPVRAAGPVGAGQRIVQVRPAAALQVEPALLQTFLERCEWPAQLRLSLNAGLWSAQVVVQDPVSRAVPLAQVARVAQLAGEVGLSALKDESHWQGGWALLRGDDGQESWIFEVRSVPLEATWLPGTLGAGQ